MKTLMIAFFAALAVAATAETAEPVPTAKSHPKPLAAGAPGSIEPVMRAALNPKIAAKIGITEEQSAKLKALAADREANKAFQAKVRRGMEKQAELLKAEKIDEAAVMSALDEVWDAKKEIAKRQTKRIIAVREILTPDQVKQVREELKSIRGERKRPQGPKGQGKRPGKAATAEQGQN